MTTNNGGSAFPHDDVVEWTRGTASYGMTLRDWFAGRVLSLTAHDFGSEEAARMAYEYADAMIAARGEE